MPVTYADIELFLAKGDPLAWATLLGVALGATLVIRLTVRFASSRLRILSSRTSFKWDDVVVDMIASTRAWVIFLWLFNSLQTLMNVSPRVDRWTSNLAVFALAMQIIFWGLDIIRGWHTTYLEAKVQRDASSAAALGLLYTAIRAGFIAVVILCALNNVGVDVHAFVAGLGVGGYRDRAGGANHPGGSVGLVFDRAG